MTWWNMPLINEEEKTKMLGHAVEKLEKPSGEVYDTTMGQPLF